MTMIFVLEKYIDYEGSVVVDVFTDIDIANATLEVYRLLHEPDDCTYSLEATEAQTQVPQFNTWWKAMGSRSLIEPPTVRAWKCMDVAFGPPPDPYVSVTNFDDHIDNPNHGLRTPPNERFTAVKARQVDCIETTKELALARALAALGTEKL